MKNVNCASVIALVAGSLGLATPAVASELSIDRAAISASHDTLSAADLGGDALNGLKVQQQQQQVVNNQQQQQTAGSLGGGIYTPSSDGFDL